MTVIVMAISISVNANSILRLLPVNTNAVPKHITHPHHQHKPSLCKKTLFISQLQDLTRFQKECLNIQPNQAVINILQLLYLFVHCHISKWNEHCATGKGREIGGCMVYCMFYVCEAWNLGKSWGKCMHGWEKYVTLFVRRRSYSHLQLLEI